ncbi:DUF3786 domain-containing protein [Eubacterium sp. AM05-23]|nr:DUF3786 domain-containing protein [Eubacterium sp. AM05-23]
MVSNYEKMKRQMQKEFLKYNQDDMIKRFNIDANERYLTVDFMGGICRIGRKNGFVECNDIDIEGFREADYNEAMTIYDLLCWSKPDAVPAGQFVNMQSISKIHSTAPSANSGFFNQEMKLFDHQDTLLREVLEKLGGVIIDGGDLAAQIPVFCGLDLLFRFWNSDDEFAPEIQFFWDANVLSFMHYETVWFANHVLIRRIREMMEKQMS